MRNNSLEKEMRLVVLTGASGSGKTAIAQAIASERPPVAEVLHFDSIGVPTAEERMEGWGSFEGGWQRAMTLEWMARISAMKDLGRPVLFEGQMRIAFLREGLSSAGLTGARIILVDCDDATRFHRLTTERCQPELVNPTMMSWAAYLRREAQEANCEVLNTTEASLKYCVEHVRLHLQS
jgi:energy-coupling factor transporter ATP-binding protein EcfA2